jgi:hypothetical protein
MASKKVQFDEQIKKMKGVDTPNFSDQKINTLVYYLTNFNKTVKECVNVEGENLYITYDFDESKYRCSTTPATSVDMITFLFMILDIILVKEDDVKFMIDIKNYYNFINDHFKFHKEIMIKNKIDKDLINIYIEIYNQYLKDIIAREKKIKEFNKLYDATALNSEEKKIIKDFEQYQKLRDKERYNRLKERSKFIESYRENFSRKKAAKEAARLQKQRYKNSCLGKLGACFGNNSNNSNNSNSN